MITYEDIEKVTKRLRTNPIKDKDYIEVNQRVKGFRMLYPQGYITTRIASLENKVVIMVAEVGYYDEEGKAVLLGTGTAYEKENSNFINSTSYIENCETSAVGRALGMVGIGIDASFASAEEVANAQLQQKDLKAKKEDKASDVNPKLVLTLQTNAPASIKECYKSFTEDYKGNLANLLIAYKLTDVNQMSMQMWQRAINIKKQQAEKKQNGGN